MHKQSTQAHSRLRKPDEAAEFLQLTRRKLEMLVAEGALPKIKLGAATRFRQSDLDALVERCVVLRRAS